MRFFAELLLIGVEALQGRNTRPHLCGVERGSQCRTTECESRRKRLCVGLSKPMSSPLIVVRTPRHREEIITSRSK